MTQDQVVALIRKTIWDQDDKPGRNGRFAEKVGVSGSFLSAVLNGKKKPTSAMCEAVGIERVTLCKTTYRRKKA